MSPGRQERATRVVFCWAGISGYMVALWRLLASSPDHEVLVIAFGSSAETSFNASLMEGIACALLSEDDRRDFNHIRGLVQSFGPDVIVISGWFHRPYRQIAAWAAPNVPLVMAMDTPWAGSARQYLGLAALRRYVGRFRNIVVPGERAWQYASRLARTRSSITRGLYGVDFDRLAPTLDIRLASEWPRRFLFIGRYAPEKGLDVLMSAYEAYRQCVPDPWELHCCGQGPLKELMIGAPGVVDHGFLQPEELPRQLAAAGVMVMPSLFDPWPLALVEGAAAGLPIICSDACGSAVELVRPLHNGIVVTTGDSASLAQALLYAHSEHAQLGTWGVASRSLARAYGNQVWARRWTKVLHDAASAPGGRPDS